jgi:hypothetical protein
MRNPYPLKVPLKNYLRYFYCRFTNKKAWMDMEDIRIENNIYACLNIHRRIAFNTWVWVGKKFGWIKLK